MRRKLRSSQPGAHNVCEKSNKEILLYNPYRNELSQKYPDSRGFLSSFSSNKTNWAAKRRIHAAESYPAVYVESLYFVSTRYAHLTNCAKLGLHFQSCIVESKGVVFLIRQNGNPQSVRFFLVVCWNGNDVLHFAQLLTGLDHHSFRPWQLVWMYYSVIVHLLVTTCGWQTSQFCTSRQSRIELPMAWDCAHNNSRSRCDCWYPYIVRLAAWIPFRKSRNTAKINNKLTN